MESKWIFIKSVRIVLAIILIASMLISIGCNNNKDDLSSLIESSGENSVSESIDESIESTQESSVDESSESGSESEVNSDSISQSESESASSSSTSSTPTLTPKPTEKPFVKPTYDLQGKTVIFWTHTGAPRSNTIEYYSWKDIEERYNCTIKFQKVDYQTAVTKNTAAALAGTAECDVWMPGWYNVYPLFITKNMVTPLSDYYEFDKDPNWKDTDAQGSLLWGGKKYALFITTPIPAHGLWYNKAMLAKANLEDPAALVKKNQWTWDKFLEMCQKLTIDTNSDGQIDQWGYYDVYLFENAIITNGGKFIDTTNPSKPVFNLNTEQNKRAIKWALDLVRTYKVVPEVGTVYNMELFDLFYTYKAAFFTNTPAFGPLAIRKGMKAEELGYTYFPKGPDADNYYLHAPTLNITYAIMPQTKLNKNALTALLADYVCIWDKSKEYAIDISEMAEYNYTKDTTNGMDKIYEANKEFLLNGHKSNVPSYVYNFLVGDIVTNNLWIPLAEGEIDIQSGITSITPTVQSTINQMIIQAS